jgi:hypothetical protein
MTDALLDHLKKYARLVFNMDGHHVPMLFAIMPPESAEGKPRMVHIAIPHLNELTKDATVEVAKELITKGAMTIALVAEAWQAQIKAEEYDAYLAGDTPRARDRDDRQEILCIVIANNQREQHWSADILDDASGRRAGQWKAQPGVAAGGRFVHLFPKATANQN